MFLDGVAARFRSALQAYANDGSDRPLDVDDSVTATADVPPVTAFQDMTAYMYRFRPNAQFDSLGHTAAVVLAVSSSAPEPMNAFSALYQQAAQDNVLRYYLVVHDATANGDIDCARGILDEVRRTYGLQCSLLVLGDPGTCAEFAADYSALDSRNTETHANVSAEDMGRLRAFVRELVTKSLVPYLERSVQQLNEQVAAARRGLTGRLIGASRRLFGAAPEDRQTVPLDTQMTRLADMAFFIRDYRLAASMYDLLRRSSAEHPGAAAAYSAEMLCISRLLHAYTSRTPAAMLEPLLAAACDGYIAAGARWHAIRAALLCADVQRLMANSEYEARILARAASIADEVLAGVLYEATAAAYLRMPNAHTRKGATMLVMAAERYRATGAAPLAVRCFARCMPHFERHGWRDAYVHVRMQLALHAHSDGRLHEALTHLCMLFGLGGERYDRDHLAELVQVFRYSGTTAVELLTPLWSKSADIATPARTTMARSVAAVGEQATVTLSATNPLSVPLTVTDIVFHFDGDAQQQPCEAVALAPHGEARVPVSVTLTSAGMLRVTRIEYVLEDAVRVTQSIAQRGPRLHATREQRINTMYGPDMVPSIEVRPALPLVQVGIEAPRTAFVGEQVAVRVSLQNTGALGAENVRISAPLVFDEPTATRVDNDAHSARTHVLGSLDAGESVVLDARLYAASPGPLEIAVRVVYDDYCASASHTLVVDPLLAVAIHTSLVDAKKYTLDIHAECIGKQAEVVGASLVSTSWVARETHSWTASLAPRERTTTRAYLEYEPLCDSLAFTLDQLHAFQQGRPVKSHGHSDVHVSSFGEFDPGIAGDMPLLFSARRSARMDQLRKSYAGVPQRVLQAFPYYGSTDVDVIVHWRASGRSGGTLLSAAIGYPDVLDDPRKLAPPARTRAMYEETAHAQVGILEALRASPLASPPAPLVVRVTAEDATFDGSTKAAPVSLHVVNASPLEVTYRLECVPAGTNSALRRDFVALPWLGRTTRRGTVPPHGSTVIDALVMVLEAGAFQLGDWVCCANTAAYNWKTTGSADTLFVAAT